MALGNPSPVDVTTCPASITLTGWGGGRRSSLEMSSFCSLLPYLLLSEPIKNPSVTRQKTEGELRENWGEHGCVFSCSKRYCPCWSSASFSSLLRNLLEHLLVFVQADAPPRDWNIPLGPESRCHQPVSVT